MNGVLSTIGLEDSGLVDYRVLAVGYTEELKNSDIVLGNPLTREMGRSNLC